MPCVQIYYNTYRKIWKAVRAEHGFNFMGRDTIKLQMLPMYEAYVSFSAHLLHCSILAPWGVSPCSGSQEYCVNRSQGISLHSPQCTMPFSWQQLAMGHSPWKGCPFVSIQPPQPQVSLYSHPVQWSPQRESTISFFIFILSPVLFLICAENVFWFLYYNI